MRVALCSEGTYPVVRGGVSTWVDQLLTRMPDYEFHVMTLVGRGAKVIWPIPENVSDLQLVQMWGPSPPLSLLARRQQRLRVRTTVEELWAVVLPPHEGAPDQSKFADALRRLVRFGESRLSSLLPQVTSAAAISNAWAAHRAVNPHLPDLTLAQAAEVGRLSDRILAVLDARLPQVDLIHLASNGPVVLPALISHWEHGTPIVLTEHGIYLRERYLALNAASWDWAVRYALMALIQSICRLAYQAAEFIVPVSQYNARWERQLGAPPSRIVTIHNGVDAADFAPITTEPDVPTVSFVGRIDPLKDLHTLVEAFAIVRRTVPDALLRIFGPTPVGNEGYAEDVRRCVAEAGLESAIAFEGYVDGSRPAFEAGHVVALSSISEGLPFTVIEAMMSGRATVSTDVGGVSETVGTDGRCGLVVPPRDAEAFASALVTLLQDGHLRAEMGQAARLRALEMFSLDLFERRFRQLYDVAALGRRGLERHAATTQTPPLVDCDRLGGRLPRGRRHRHRQMPASPEVVGMASEISVGGS